MARSGQEVLCEGWLTKSPPTKRIWRAKWRRRWFSLTQSGELPGQYILTYYADRNCRKVKGVIDLDHCEQVDLGLKLEERKLKFDHVFDIKTPLRTYFLAADTESEMHSWVKTICKVCGLKLTDEQDLYIPVNPSGVEIIEEPAEVESRFNETPPISPVSTSPYIPISECITGKSPILDPQDFNTLLKYNIKNSIFHTDAHINDTYEQHHNYYNYDMQDPRFYDCPRKLVPVANKEETTQPKQPGSDKNASPLQSPTDSESVFTDDDWVHNTSSELNTSKNGDSTYVDLVATQRYTKSENSSGVPPPRPPKPTNANNTGASYLNLTPAKNAKETDNESVKNSKDGQKVVTDDMYDFPRSHVNHAEDASKNPLMRRHCYNNAAPVSVEGNVFRYDISPKPGSSTGQMFRYDLDECQDEPASPHSQTSSTAPYSNLPSPLLTEQQLMPPPKVNRDLKPKRKLSDSHSISSNPESTSPRIAPCVDRKLKPPTPLQEAHGRKHFNVEDENRKVRAGPSPTPPSLDRSHESLLNQEDNEQAYHILSGRMQYLDLDLESGSSNSNTNSNTNLSSNNTKTLPSKSSTDNVYKKIDFVKTHAFNVTRNILEKERQEPVVFKK